MKHNTCTDYGKKVLVQTNNQTSALDSGTFSPKYWNIWHRPFYPNQLFSSGDQPYQLQQAHTHRLFLKVRLLWTVQSISQKFIRNFWVPRMAKQPPGFVDTNNWKSVETSVLILTSLSYATEGFYKEWQFNILCNVHKPHHRLLRSLCNPREQTGYTQQTFLPMLAINSTNITG